MAQAKMYLKVMEDVTHLLHGTIREVRGRRLKRGKSWMAEAEETLSKVCELEDLKSGKEWVELSQEGRIFTQVVIKMGWEQREVADVVTEQAILALVAENTKPDDPVIYTDGSVQRGVKSGWGGVLLCTRGTR